jgi:hypothetical protein
MASNDVFGELAETLSSSETVRQAGGQPWSPELVMYLATAILVITALALVLGTFLMWKKPSNGQEVLRLYGVVIIVGLSALLLVTGFSNSQLTPIVGLFGAIAGYLLGKDSSKDNNDKPPPN